MKATLSQLVPWILGSRMTADAIFDGISIDSRQVQPNHLFIALRGDRVDAHQFLANVVDRKASAVLVERLPENYPLPALLVMDTRRAMREIAMNWRRRFSIPVIGVSGSNGKTTVKEMIASVFRVAYGENAYLATQGNFNNDIGVPLTLFGLDEEHKAAVIELGMNHVGEMTYLTAMAQPTIGLVNNAQREHQEFLHSVEAVAQENGTIIRTLPQDGIAVFPADDLYAPLWKGYAVQRRVVTFGFNGTAEVTGSFQMEKDGMKGTLFLAGETVRLTLSISGQHNAHNAMAAAACCLAAGIDKEAIAQGLANFVPVHGRLERKTAFNGARLIDDTYNANPDSVRAAIDVLADMSSDSVLVLGDMGETGDNGALFHIEVGEYARKRKIKHFVTYGEMARFASQGYGEGAQHFTDWNAMGTLLGKWIEPQMTVLVKGSRFMGMERLVEQLMTGMSQEGC